MMIHLGLLYSFTMEAFRSKKNASSAIGAGIGAGLGFLCGSLLFLFDAQPVLYKISDR